MGRKVPAEMFRPMRPDLIARSPGEGGSVTSTIKTTRLLPAGVGYARQNVSSVQMVAPERTTTASFRDELQVGHEVVDAERRPAMR